MNAVINESDESIDLTSFAFARRLANLLKHRRGELKLSIRAMSRRSDGRFGRRQLKDAETGKSTLDAVTVSALAALYGIDVEQIIPRRVMLAIAPEGTIATSGVTHSFDPADPDSLLESYLRLVRRLRGQERDDVISLRREDIDQLAAYLRQPGATVVERLGALMGATKSQRRAMAGLFMTGALVITIAAPTVTALTLSNGHGDAAFHRDAHVPVNVHFDDAGDVDGDVGGDQELRPITPVSFDGPDDDGPGDGSGSGDATGGTGDADDAMPGVPNPPGGTDSGTPEGPGTPDGPGGDDAPDSTPDDRADDVDDDDDDDVDDEIATPPPGLPEAPPAPDGPGTPDPGDTPDTGLENAGDHPNDNADDHANPTPGDTGLENAGNHANDNADHGQEQANDNADDHANPTPGDTGDDDNELDDTEPAGSNGQGQGNGGDTGLENAGNHANDNADHGQEQANDNADDHANPTPGDNGDDTPSADNGQGQGNGQGNGQGQGQGQGNGDKDTGLANAGQHANGNAAGGQASANQNANQNANPNR